MSARWDDNEPADQRERWLLKVMTLLSLDVTRAVVADLGLDEHAHEAAQPELRRVLAPLFQARLAAPSASFDAERLLGSLDPDVRAMVRAFYDGVLRYQDAQPNALFCWGIVLMRCAQTPALWDSLSLPPESSSALRGAFWATRESDDIQERADAVCAKPLSAWDTQVAVLRLLPPLDEGQFGIGAERLAWPAQVVRQQGFWRSMAGVLGPEGLRTLHVHCQAYLATQADIAPAFGKLHDPWLLAHPELDVPDTSDPSPPGGA